MLVAAGLGKSYRGHKVVRDVDLEVRPGKIVGLVGANGAGKTTTLKMLAGLVEPTTGSATLDGMPTSHPFTRIHLGYLPEESPLYDDEDAISYLIFFGSLYGLPRADAKARAQALLKQFHLDEEHWKKPLGTLSKGQRRKVALACCLLHDPSVLILDEPTSGLDPLTTAEVGAHVRKLREDGKAVLLSAHNLPQVEQLCDEILVMHGGRVVTRGSLTELRGRLGTQRYRLRATVEFPDSKPEGTLHEGWFTSLAAVEKAMDAVRKAQGIVLEVESVPPKLEEILQRAAEA